MMQRVFICSIVLAIVASSAWAQSVPLGDVLDVRFQSHLLRSAMADQAGLTSAAPPSDYLTPYLLRQATNDDLSLRIMSARFLGIEPYEVSRATLALEGASQGAALGLFLGAVGTTTGLFDDNTAWYVAGAMAAMGALLGGTVNANDPSKRLRWQWNVDAESHWATKEGPKDLEHR